MITTNVNNMTLIIWLSYSGVIFSHYSGINSNATVNEALSLHRKTTKDLKEEAATKQKVAAA